MNASLQKTRLCFDSSQHSERPGKRVVSHGDCSRRDVAGCLAFGGRADLIRLDCLRLRLARLPGGLSPSVSPLCMACPIASFAPPGSSLAASQLNRSRSHCASILSPFSVLPSLTVFFQLVP